MASPFFIWGTCPVVGRHYYGAVLHRQAGIAQRSVHRLVKAKTWVRIPFLVKTVGANLYKETHLGKQELTAAGEVARLTNLAQRH